MLSLNQPGLPLCSSLRPPLPLPLFPLPRPRPRWSENAAASPCPLSIWLASSMALIERPPWGDFLGFSADSTLSAARNVSSHESIDCFKTSTLRFSFSPVTNRVLLMSSSTASLAPSFNRLPSGVLWAGSWHSSLNMSATLLTLSVKSLTVSSCLCFRSVSALHMSWALVFCLKRASMHVLKSSHVSNFPSLSM
jgi:hypothetical protein